MRPIRDWRRLPACAAMAGGAALAFAGHAGAAVTISGADTDVWNAGSPEVRYVLTTDLGSRIAWALEEIAPGGDGTVPARGGVGNSPVTVTAPSGDGTFRITARDLLFPAQRTFVVDRTPPAIRIVRPADRSAVQQGAAAVAEYTCTGAVRCAGTVASGARLDTSRTGPVTLRVDAADAAGNTAAAQVTLLVAAPPAAGGPTPPPNPPSPAGPAGAAGPASDPANPPVTVLAQPRERPVPGRFHRRLLPRLNGVVETLRPVLRWPRMTRARLYNVQVFRVRAGRDPVKVASLFPRAHQVRIPAKRLTDGARYAWRVWPFLRSGYSPSPLGLSAFSVDLGRRR